MIKEKIIFSPKLSLNVQSDLLNYARVLKKYLTKKNSEQKYFILLKEKEQLFTKYSGHKIHIHMDLAFCESLLLDLLLQDWELHIKNGQIQLELLTSEESERDQLQEKAKTRRRHLLARDNQLREKSVSEFIKNMERKRLTASGWHSIFSLMRDGQELSEIIKEIKSTKTEDQKNEVLNGLIKPYIEIVEQNKKCEHTGIPLMDIWRYFRHTWVNEYKSLPGRTISILVRDAAHPNHPIIGIAALGSSVAQQTCRDEWIGWEGKTFLKELEAKPTSKNAAWIKNMLGLLLSEIYIKDFLKEYIITLKDIKEPTLEKIRELRNLSDEYKKKHFQNPSSSKFSSDNKSLTWEERAKSYLFKSKRALYLSDILGIVRVFNKCNYKYGTKKELLSSLEKPEFKEAVEKLIRKVKSLSVGINMMDIIVCGSIAPYNHLLGGKLVCMLLTSPEITNYYNKKYAESISLIASSMRGKAVNRVPKLVLLGTTSLYGNGSSQYNRIKIPSLKNGVDQTMEYKHLGYSEGYGSFHFSNETIKLADAVTGRENGRTRVNSIFGEGANPLLRKLKDAMEYLQLDSNPILNHRNRRIVYGIALANNFRKVLMGIEDRPKYFFPQRREREISAEIAKYWIKRWLSNRIMNDDVVKRVSENTLEYPITHGARVQLQEEEIFQTDEMWK